MEQIQFLTGDADTLNELYNKNHIFHLRNRR